MVAVGATHLGVITAITVSGCSLLFLALLRSSLAHKEEGGVPPSSSSPPLPPPPMGSGLVSAEGKKKKKKKDVVVRFEERVVDHGAEPRARLRGGDRVGKGGRPIPENRRALYRGLWQYRSQMATLMLYHA